MQNTIAASTKKVDLRWEVDVRADAARAWCLGESWCIEDSVGAGIAASGVPRSSLYITTKLDRLPAGTTVRDALVESLKKLRVDHVDQFFVHMPVDHPDLKQTWKDMEAVHAEGLAKAIGVSNFQPKHLDVILDGAKVTPAVNQVRTLITFIFYLRLIINPP